MMPLPMLMNLCHKCVENLLGRSTSQGILCVTYNALIHAHEMCIKLDSYTLTSGMMTLLNLFSHISLKNGPIRKIKKPTDSLDQGANICVDEISRICQICEIFWHVKIYCFTVLAKMALKCDQITRQPTTLNCFEISRYKI